MSKITEEEVKQLALLITNHKAINEFRDRVKMILFKNFVAASDEKRAKIGDMMQAESMLFNEIFKVIAEIETEKPAEEEEIVKLDK